MDVIKIEGDHPITGEVTVEGAKNSALKLMAEVSREHGGASVIAVAPVPADQVSRYGIIAGKCVGSLPGTDASDEEEGAVWKVTGLVEKPRPEDAPSHLFIVGRYLLSPRIMELLAVQGPGAGNEIQLTDAMSRLKRG